MPFLNGPLRLLFGLGENSLGELLDIESYNLNGAVCNYITPLFENADVGVVGASSEVINNELWSCGGLCK